MECIKILGLGKQGIVFLTLNNKVIKIQSSKDKKISIGDYFGINIGQFFIQNISANVKFIMPRKMEHMLKTKE